MASPAATTAATFAAANTAMLTATHLNQTHLERMFRFRDLRNECRRALRDDVPPLITQLEALSDADLLARSNARDRKAAGISTNSLDNVAAPKKASLRAAIARRETLQGIANTNADAQFFGMTYLNALDAYTRGGGAWREDLAAWQRVALREMQTNLQTVPGQQFPGNVGQRVENAATEDEGLWLAYERFSQRARAVPGGPRARRGDRHAGLPVRRRAPQPRQPRLRRSRRAPLPRHPRHGEPAVSAARPARPGRHGRASAPAAASQHHAAAAEAAGCVHRPDRDRDGRRGGGQRGPDVGERTGVAVPAGGSPDGTWVRAAELIAALSLATDIGSGLPFEYGLQSTVVARRRGESFGFADLTASQSCSAEKSAFAASSLAFATPR